MKKYIFPLLLTLLLSGCGPKLTQEELLEMADNRGTIEDVEVYAENGERTEDVLADNELVTIRYVRTDYSCGTVEIILSADNKTDKTIALQPITAVNSAMLQNHYDWGVCEPNQTGVEFDIPLYSSDIEEITDQLRDVVIRFDVKDDEEHEILATSAPVRFVYDTGKAERILTAEQVLYSDENLTISQVGGKFQEDGNEYDACFLMENHTNKTLYIELEDALLPNDPDDCSVQLSGWLLPGAHGIETMRVFEFKGSVTEETIAGMQASFVYYEYVSGAETANEPITSTGMLNIE